MNQKIANPSLKLPAVRLSFPHLFTPQKGDDADSKAKYGATFILDKKIHAATIKEVQAAIATVTKSDKLKGRKPTKVCLRDGAEKDHLDGYGDGVMFLSARNQKRCPVVDRNLTPLVEEDGKPYAGCYVNATIEIYPYTHPKSGPGITASLRAVQFLKDGEPFGEKPADVASEFENLEEAEGVV